jgi:hypothetical protein
MLRRKYGNPFARFVDVGSIWFFRRLGAGVPQSSTACGWYSGERRPEGRRNQGASAPSPLHREKKRE